MHPDDLTAERSRPADWPEGLRAVTVAGVVDAHTGEPVEYRPGPEEARMLAQLDRMGLADGPDHLAREIERLRALAAEDPTFERLCTAHATTDPVMLASAFPPDRVGAWGVELSLRATDLRDALGRLMTVEREHVRATRRIPDQRLRALMLGTWTAFRARIEPAGSRAGVLASLRPEELIELGAESETPRGDESRPDIQRRREYARRRARRAVE